MINEGHGPYSPKPSTSCAAGLAIACATETREAPLSAEVAVTLVRAVMQVMKLEAMKSRHDA